LGLQDSPVRVFGWIENSFTGNANGTPQNGQNFGVFPNHLANRWMGNQYYLALENPLESVDYVNFGFRFDMLFGNDWLFTKDYGLFDNAFPINHFAGLDLPQIYGEVHLPVLTPRGLDIRAGRFYSLMGFESPQAIARPLLSVPYMLNFTPFTFFGAIASLHLSDRVNFHSGMIDGYDRWPNKPYKWGYMGGLTWTSRDQKMNIVIGGADAYDQLPRFPPANATYVPVGVPAPPFMAGRVNPYYNKSARGYISGVLTYKWTDKLTQALETDHVFDPQILGFGRDPLVAHSAAYHSFGNWFLYQFTEKLTGVWRSEIFWDPYGLATGVADVFHEMTLGLNIRPEPWLWIRPEARYDWSQYTLLLATAREAANSRLPSMSYCCSEGGARAGTASSAICLRTLRHRSARHAPTDVSVAHDKPDGSGHKNGVASEPMVGAGAWANGRSRVDSLFEKSSVTVSKNSQLLVGWAAATFHGASPPCCSVMPLRGRTNLVTSCPDPALSGFALTVPTQRQWAGAYRLRGTCCPECCAACRKINR